MSYWSASIKRYFPNDYRYQISHDGLDEKAISEAAMDKVIRGWRQLLKKYHPILDDALTGSSFLDTWYAAPVLKEALAARALP